MQYVFFFPSSFSISYGLFLATAWLFELAGGALVDFEDNCIPKAQRQASFNVAALHQWDIDFQDPRCVHSAEEVGFFFSAIHPVVMLM
jgi:hypothetical protein